jgi:hypothetical protein
MGTGSKPQGRQRFAGTFTNVTKTITFGDLKVGDLVFNWDPAEGSSGHVALITAANAGMAFNTHQTNGANRKGTWETVINPAQPDELHIYRCANSELARSAADIAKAWSRYVLAFDYQRLDQGTLHDMQGSGGGSMVARHRELFARGGKFRAIKYAARRDGIPCYPGGAEKEDKGMFCSMFVAVCYQVAGLGNAVKAADPRDLMLRVSDKQMGPKDIKKHKGKFSGLFGAKLGGKHGKVDFQHYDAYVDGLHTPNPYELREIETSPVGLQQALSSPAPKPRAGGVTYLPSILYWNYDRYPSIEAFPWADRITEGMMVDAKVVMPTSLLTSLQTDDKAWSFVGKLTGQMAPFTAQDKLDDKARVTATKDQANRLKQPFRRT